MQVLCKNKTHARQWWCTFLIPALGRERQTDLSELEASLIYKASSRTARTVTQRNPVSKNQQKFKDNFGYLVSSGLTQNIVLTYKKLNNSKI